MRYLNYAKDAVQKDQRDSYDMQIAEKNSKIRNISETETAPRIFNKQNCFSTRNKANDLQSEEQRKGLWMNELGNSKLPIIHNRIQSEFVNRDYNGNNMHSVENPNDNKNKKRMDLNGSISLGKLVPQSNATNPLERHELKKKYQENLDKQIADREKLREKYNNMYCNITDTDLEFNSYFTNNKDFRNEPGQQAGQYLGHDRRRKQQDFLQNSSEAKRQANREISGGYTMPDYDARQVSGYIENVANRQRIYNLQRSDLEDFKKGSNMNRDFVRVSGDNKSIYLDVKRNGGNNSSIYNIISGI